MVSGGQGNQFLSFMNWIDPNRLFHELKARIILFLILIPIFNLLCKCFVFNVRLKCCIKATGILIRFLIQSVEPDYIVPNAQRFYIDGTFRSIGVRGPEGSSEKQMSIASKLQSDDKSTNGVEILFAPRTKRSLTHHTPLNLFSACVMLSDMLFDW